MARKFRFAGQKILEWYRQSLAAEQVKLHEIATQIRELETSLHSLELERTKEKETLQAQPAFNGRDLENLAYFIDATDDEIARLQNIRRIKLSALEEQRSSVVAHHRRVRLLEKLEERKRQEWLHGLNLEETALAADLFLASTCRDKAAQDAAERASERKSTRI